MDKFDAMLQDVVNQEYDQILLGAKSVLGDAIDILKRRLDDEQINSVLIYFIASAIAIDGTFTAQEKKFINDLFGNVDFMELLKTVDLTVTGAMDEVVDSLNDEEKSTLCLLAIYILAVDENINKDEYKYLNKLLG